MPKRSLNELIQIVHRLAGQPEVALTDGELLARFVDRRDEAAFEALVWRHGQLTWNVCWRVLRNQQDAEDAFQATFLVLARKASSIRERRALGGWLYQIAQRIALGIRKKVKCAGLPLVDVADDSGAAAEQMELKRLLEEEIDRLPRKYRLPLVLRYLEGRSTDETAAIVGCPRGTVLSRLAWSRRRLQARLATRGVGLSVALAALGATQSQAAPMKVILSAASTGLLFTANSALRTGRPVSLAKGVLRAMLMTKIAAGSIGGLMLLTASVGLGLAVLPRMGDASTHSTLTNQYAHADPSQVGPIGEAGAIPDEPEPPRQEAQKPDDVKIPKAMFIHPVPKTIAEAYEFRGITEASRTVEVGPASAGTLTRVVVKPGGLVKQGELLFELDSAQRQTELVKAQAEVMRAEAQVAQVELITAQTTKLAKSNVTSENEVNLAKAKLAEAHAGLQVAKATLQARHLQLQAVRITAPMDGRIGRVRVDVGSPVDHNTVLATIVSVKPLYVAFKIDEQSFSKLEKYLLNPADAKAVELELHLSSGKRSGEKGRLESVDNQFDPKTGTITAVASFPNASGVLLPGMYAGLRFSTPEKTDAVVIPQAALAPGLVKSVVYVLTDDNVIRERRITFEQGRDAGTYLVKSGLKPTDRVVVAVQPKSEFAAGVKVEPVASWKQKATPQRP
jgi:RND family efflux transporter MFP subunit